MGDFFQSLVDAEAREDESAALADEILVWLVAEDIVLPGVTDCTLGEGGHAPGPNYMSATEFPDAHLHSLRTNGLEVTTQRTVFDAGQGGIELVCCTCSSRFEDPPEDWGAALDEWFETGAPVPLACPACGANRSVIEWGYDPPWGFGSLGFTFWNWPELSPGFIDRLARRLGHRVVLVAGKL